jgi:YgiT-type zinc finger domain-containing protein
MKCSVCGDTMARIVSDLPLKTTDHTIVILKGVPVLQCGNCADYLIEDAVLARMDEILAGVVGEAELEIIRYAA